MFLCLGKLRVAFPILGECPPRSADPNRLPCLPGASFPILCLLGLVVAAIFRRCSIPPLPCTSVSCGCSSPPFLSVSSRCECPQIRSVAYRCDALPFPLFVPQFVATQFRRTSVHSRLFRISSLLRLAHLFRVLARARLAPPALVLRILSKPFRFYTHLNFAMPSLRGAHTSVLFRVESLLCYFFPNRWIALRLLLCVLRFHAYHCHRIANKAMLFLRRWLLCIQLRLICTCFFPPLFRLCSCVCAALHSISESIQSFQILCVSASVLLWPILAMRIRFASARLKQRAAVPSQSLHLSAPPLPVLSVHCNAVSDLSQYPSLPYFSRILSEPRRAYPLQVVGSHCCAMPDRRFTLRYHSVACLCIFSLCKPLSFVFVASQCRFGGCLSCSVLLPISSARCCALPCRSVSSH